VLFTSGEALRLVRAHADAHWSTDAISLCPFGATVRDEAGEASDLNLSVDYENDGVLSAIERVRLKHHSSDALEVEAVVTARDGLHPLTTQP
jgi:uncharacterized protein